MTDLTTADRLLPVTVYGRPGCQQCATTTRKLAKHGIPHTYVNIDDDPTAATLVDTYAARTTGPLTLPLVTVGDVYWFGFRHERIARLADIHHAAADIAPLDQAAQHYLEEAGA